MSETITINGEPHQIESKRVTLVFNSDGSRIRYPDRVMITPEMALNHYRELDEIEPITAALVEKVVGRRLSKADLDGCDEGFQALAGRMALTVRLMAYRHQVGWSYPETGLHPKYQGNLADVMLLLTDSQRLIQFVSEARRADR
jgi:hypothetical protein